MSTATWGLYDRADLSTLVHPLDKAKSVSCTQEYNRPGQAQIELQNDDTALNAITKDSVLRFFLDGQPVFSSFIDLEDRRTIDQGEEGAQRTVLTGPGLLAILKEAIVYPSRGVGRLPIEEERAFSWASPFYVASLADWDPATEVAPQGVDLSPHWSGMPTDWPEPDLPLSYGGDRTMWIWNADGNNNWAPAATTWMRHNFTVPAGVGEIIIYMGCDNEADLYFEGQKVLEGKGSPPLDTHTVKIPVAPGSYTIAAKVTNHAEPDPVDLSGNPAGLLVAVFASDQTTIDYGTNIEHTNDQWIVTRDEPGMTPGQIVMLAVDEAQTRGAIPDVTFTFDEDVDSAGQAWPLINTSTRVGNTLLDFFAEMEDSLVLEMSPDSFALQAWTAESYGTARDATFRAPTNPLVPSTGNLTGLTHKRSS